MNYQPRGGLFDPPRRQDAPDSRADFGGPPAEQVELWKKRDPIPRFEKFLEASGLIDAAKTAALRKEVEEEVAVAARAAEQVGPPGLETIFSDVYATIPAHLRKQGEELFDLGRRRGDAHAGDGKFPL